MAPKAKITVTVDAALLDALEQYKHHSRSELIEAAMRLYRKQLIDQELMKFYAQHQETPDEQAWMAIATNNLEAAFTDDSAR